MNKTAHRKPDLEEIRRNLRAHFTVLRERYGVKSLGLFGSYVRGEQKVRSDLDILVEYETAPSFFQFIELEDYLSQISGVKVDLVMKKALKPRIGERILHEVQSV